MQEKNEVSTTSEKLEACDVAKNTVHDAVIEGYTSEGFGVARIGNLVVFVKGAISGELCRVKILKRMKTAAFAKIEQVIEPSEHRVQPECPVFGRCGGCDLMHMNYDEELRLKRQRVADALKRIGGVQIESGDIELIGADAVQACRNKGIYAVGVKNGKAVSGFYRARSHDIVPVEQCFIQSPLADKAAAAVRRWMDKCAISAYDEFSGEGEVRHIYTRVSREGKILVTVVCAKRPRCIHELVAEITESCENVAGVVLNLNGTRGNTVLAGNFHTLWGEGTLNDTLCGLQFRLSPRSFYQVNANQAEKLYGKVLEYAQLESDCIALDLYCGTGTITLCLSKQAGRVIGAEVVAASVADARENAKRNGVSNAEFICADAAEAAAMLEEKGLAPDVVVVDPPRKGLAENVIESIVLMDPKRVVYVSCECATLARDVAIFAKKGYELKKATALDMFPRTANVETVVLLLRETYPQSIEVKIDVSDGEVTEQPTYKRIQEYVEKNYGFKVHTAYIAEVKRMCGLDMHKAPNAVEQRKHQYHPCPPEKVDAIKDALRHFGMI